MRTRPCVANQLHLDKPCLLAPCTDCLLGTNVRWRWLPERLRHKPLVNQCYMPCSYHCPRLVGLAKTGDGNGYCKWKEATKIAHPTLNGGINTP